MLSINTFLYNLLLSLKISGEELFSNIAILFLILVRLCRRITKIKFKYVNFKNN